MEVRAIFPSTFDSGSTRHSRGSSCSHVITVRETRLEIRERGAEIVSRRGANFPTYFPDEVLQTLPFREEDPADSISMSCVIIR